jgi:hypothetical protein
MKNYILLSLSALSCLGTNQVSASARIINNSNASVHVDYDLPIYSRADTTIKPIKSQQELQDLLHEAILTNSTQAIMQVVKAGADVNSFKDGKAPLMWATLHKKLNSIGVLKKCGAVIPCTKNMLNRAILNDSADDIRHAVNAGAEAIRGIGMAIQLARPNSIQALLECGATPSIGSAWQSILIGDIKSALLLLKKTSVSKYAPGELLACKKDNKYIFEYVLTEIDPTGIRDIWLELLQVIIDHGYNINSSASQTREINGQVTEIRSAWIHAINSPFDSTKVLELLMKNGANPNQLIYDQANCSWTPLLIAIQENNLSAVKFLLDAGADLTKKAGPSMPSRRSTTNPSGTPLSYAQALAFTHVENQEIIDLLIKHGAR